jgi:hypothetical protein
VSQIVSSYWQREVSAPAYARMSDLYSEIAEIVRREIEALLAEGVPYIQLDAPRVVELFGRLYSFAIVGVRCLQTPSMRPHDHRSPAGRQGVLGA